MAITWASTVAVAVVGGCGNPDEGRTPATQVAATTTSAAPQPGLVNDLSGFCQRLGPALPDNARSLALDDQHSSPVYQLCEWGRDPNSGAASTPPLTVVAKAYFRYDAGGKPDFGAVDEALAKAKEVRASTGKPPGDAQPVEALGDWSIVYDSDGGAKVDVLIRNVTIDVSWAPPDGAPVQAREQAVAIARAAAHGI